MSTDSKGVWALGAFFLFGTCMSGLSFVSLLTPGGPLEPMWRLNPQAREAFSHMGGWAVLLMGTVSVACALAVIGLLKRAIWGYGLALGILVTNVLGDAVSAFVRGDLRTLIGIPIGGLLIAYLARAKMRQLFRTTTTPDGSPERPREG